MTNIINNDRLPPIPRSTSPLTARALSTSVLGGMCDVVNYLAEWRSKKGGHWQVFHDWGAGLVGASLAYVIPKGAVTHRFAYRVGARATHLQIVFGYQAGEPSTSVVEAWVETLAGASVDGSSAIPACSWVASEGSLSVDQERVPATSNSAVGLFRRLVASTGDFVVTSPSGTTRPRPLDVSPVQGQVVQIALRATDVRIFSVSAVELFAEAVPQ